MARTVLANGCMTVPPYHQGDVLKKGERKYLVIDEKSSYLFQDTLRLKRIKTGKISGQYFSPKFLAVMGFEIIGHRTEDADMAKEKKENKWADYWCNRGELVSLEDCEIIEGKSPYKQHGRLQFEKGSVIADTLAVCRICGKKVRVKLNRQNKQFYLVKHAPRRLKKSEMPKASKRTKAPIKQRRRTK